MEISEYSDFLDGLSQIDIDGLGGQDTLIIDDSNGLIDLPDGIRFNGGLGFDTLVLRQNPGGEQQTSDTYSVGPNTGEGTSIIVGPSGTQTVFFEDLEPVLDTVLAASLTVNGTPADNAINYTAGARQQRPGQRGQLRVHRVQQQGGADDQRRSGPRHY